MQSKHGVIFTGKKIELIDHAKTGEEMRRLRESSGKSLRAVAAKMGISAPYLSDLEKGRRNWTVARAMAFQKEIK